MRLAESERRREPLYNKNIGYAFVAHLVERGFEGPGVRGSTPREGTNLCPVSLMERMTGYEPVDAGPIPARGAKSDWLPAYEYTKEDSEVLSVNKTIRIFTVLFFIG